MTSIRGWALAATLASAAGCSCASAHEIEDGGTDATPASDVVEVPDTSPDDALVPAIDAGPEPRYFTLEDAVVDLIVRAERCEEHEGASAMLRVTVHYFSSCDTPGPLDAVVDAAAHTVIVTPHVWHEHGRTDCASIGAAYERDVVVRDLTAGTWMVSGGATTLSWTVSGPGPSCVGLPTLPRGSRCDADCECTAGLACLAVRGDATCARFCADPCEVLGAGTDPAERSCPEAEACTSDADLGWVCESTTTPECDATRTCPAGMSCPPVTEGPPQCVWDVVLDSSIRHACASNGDCDAGLDCVQRTDGTRTCEVRCTTSDMACPNATPHACMPGNWVCEWLGE